MTTTSNSITNEPNESAEGAASDVANVGSSAALISFFVIISRITGFMRTWAMAFALGSTMLASSYQVANNLPNMLYELVVGGMASASSTVDGELLEELAAGLRLL